MCGRPSFGKVELNVLRDWSVRPCVRPHMMVSPSSADLDRPRSKAGLSFLQASPANLTSGGN